MTSDNLQKVTHIVYDTYRYCVRLYKVRERNVSTIGFIEIASGQKKAGTNNNRKKKDLKKKSRNACTYGLISYSLEERLI